MEQINQQKLLSSDYNEKKSKSNKDASGIGSSLLIHSIFNTVY